MIRGMGASPRVMLTGATGYLGHHLMRSLSDAGADVVAPGRRVGTGGSLDLEDPDGCAACVERVGPDIVIHAAAMSRMGDCEADPANAERCNAQATAALAAAARRICYVSTDLVFDGDRAPYRGDSTAEPRSAYGVSKLAGETAVRDRATSGLVVRVPLLFGPSFDGRRGATDMLRAARADGRQLGLFTNEYRTPLHVAVAARELVRLALGDRTGVVHLAGPERISRFDFAQRFAAAHGADVLGGVDPVVCDDADRPRDVSMVGDVEISESLDAMLAES